MRRSRVLVLLVTAFVAALVVNAGPAAAAVPVVASQRAVVTATATLTKAALPVLAATAPGTPCAATVRACIDLTHNQAWLISGGVVEFGPVPITSGRKGFRTPAGTFHVLYRQRLHLSHEFNNAPMPFSVFFIPGIAFHQGSLSVPSHGCIHLSRAVAMRFFTELRVGDVVQAVR